MEASLFYELGALFMVAAGLAIFATLLRLPLVLSYIVTGLLVGSGLVPALVFPDGFSSFAHFGIALLLFSVGLSLNWQAMRSLGSRVVVLGLGQVVLTTALGYLVGRALNIPEGTALFFGLAFAFSSTIMVVKFLSDREELDTLHGRLAVGILLLQDVVAMLALLLLSAPSSLATFWTLPIAQTASVMVLVMVTSLWILPSLMRFCARSSELQLLVSLGWCFAVATLLHTIGFGIEMSALVAGVSLSGTGMGRSLASRIRPLRDFFLVPFFILLGATVNPAILPDAWIGIVAYSIFLLVGNPLIIVFVARLLGYHAHTGWLAGAPLGQVSEFSFILLSAGVVAGVIPDATLTIGAAVGLITMMLSTLVMEYDEAIYRFVSRLFGRSARARFSASTSPEIFLLGAHRMGERLFPALQKISKRVRVIDMDPHVIERMRARAVDVHYGDLTDHGFVEDLGLEKARLITSTLPDAYTSLAILEGVRARGFTGVFVARAKNAVEAHTLKRAGADYVIVPPLSAGSVLAQHLGTFRFSKLKWHKAHLADV